MGQMNDKFIIIITIMKFLLLVCISALVYVSASVVCSTSSLSAQYACHGDVCAKLPLMIKSSAQTTYINCIARTNNATICTELGALNCLQLSQFYSDNIYTYLGCSSLDSNICPSKFTSGASSSKTLGSCLIVLFVGFLIFQ